jgi:polyisoprenoid-binding protein YceI
MTSSSVRGRSPTTTATLQRTPRVTITADSGRWLVQTHHSVASIRTDLPFGRAATARFTEIAGVVDLAGRVDDSVVLLIGAHSLETESARRRRRWLGPHMLDADDHPRIALVLDDVRATATGLEASGRLHVKRRMAGVDARIHVDEQVRHCTITFSVDRDAIDLVWAQMAGATHRVVGRRVDVVIDLAVTPRARGVRR